MIFRLNIKRMYALLASLMLVLLFAKYHFYLTLLGTPIGIIELLSPLALLFFLLKLRVRLDAAYIGLAFYAFIGIFFCVISVFISGQWRWLAILIPHAIIPILFFLAGKYINAKSLSKIIFLGILVCFISVLAQVYENLNLPESFSFYWQVFGDYTRGKQELWAGRVLFGRPVGVFVNPNLLGLFSGLSIWAVLILRPYYSKLIYWFCLVACIAMTIFSGSRGSLAAIILSFIIFFSFPIPNFLLLKKFWIHVLFVLFFLFLILLYQDLEIKDRFSVFFSFSSLMHDSNFAGRLESWGNIINYISNNFFGTLILPQFILKKAPDNQFMYFFAQGGFIYALAYLLMLFGFFVGFCKKNALGRAGLGLVVFMFVNSMTMVSFNISLSGLFFLLIGYLLYNPQRVRNINSPQRVADAHPKVMVYGK